MVTWSLPAGAQRASRGLSHESRSLIHRGHSALPAAPAASPRQRGRRLGVEAMQTPERPPLLKAPPPQPHQTSPARGLFLLILFTAWAADGVFLFSFVMNPVDFCLTSREAIDYVDVSFVYVRMAAALSATVLGFLGFSLALRPAVHARRMDRALAVLACEVLAGVAASAGLLGPSSEPRRDAVRHLLYAHLAAASFAGLHALITRRGIFNTCYERWSAALRVRYWRVAGRLTGGCSGGATSRDNEATQAHKMLNCNVTVDLAHFAGAAHRAAQETATPEAPYW